MKHEAVDLESRWNLYSLQTTLRGHTCGICSAVSMQAAEDGWRWRWKAIPGKRGRYTDVRCSKCYGDEWKRTRAGADWMKGCARCGSTALTHDVVGQGIPRVTCDVCAWHCEGDAIPRGLRSSASRLLTVMMASLSALMLCVMPAMGQVTGGVATRITARADASVTTTAQQLYAADDSRRNVVCVNRSTTSNVRFGPSTITTLTGLILGPGQTITFTNATYAIYAIAEVSGTVAVSCGADFR